MASVRWLQLTRIVAPIAAPTESQNPMHFLRTAFVGGTRESPELSHPEAHCRMVLGADVAPGKPQLRIGGADVRFWQSEFSANDVRALD